MDLYRLLKEGFKREREENKSLLDKMDVLSHKMDEISQDWRSMDQRLTRLEHDARQPHLVMEADGPANTKTRERTEGAATAVQAIHGDSCTAQRVQDGPKISICFGVMAEPPTLPCWDDFVVENGAVAPKSCLPSMEMRSSTATRDLLPTGKASIATRTTFNQPPLRLYLTEETNSKKTSTSYISYDSSLFQKNNLPAVSSCRRVIETKSGESRMFDPGGPQGHLRACPYFGSWRALLCGEVYVRAGRGYSVFWRIDDSGLKNLQEWYGRNIYAIRIAVNRYLFEAGPALNMPCQDKGMRSGAALDYRS